jgi:hypothetical protein
MAAKEAHLLKYVVQHRRNYPSSRILVVRCPLANMLWYSRHRRAVEPAVPVLQAAIQRDIDSGPATAANPPRVLVHVFSNGGIASLIALSSILQRRGSPSAFPRHVMVMDSCPGYWNFRRAHGAFTVGMSFVAKALTSLALAVLWCVTVPWGVEPVPDKNARLLLEPPLLSQTVSRTYMYGTADRMVPATDVEDHADKAASKGLPVKKEPFQGAQHVSLMRADAQRYWSLVKEAWDQRASPRG